MEGCTARWRKAVRRGVARQRGADGQLHRPPRDWREKSTVMPSPSDARERGLCLELRGLREVDGCAENELPFATSTR